MTKVSSPKPLAPPKLMLPVDAAKQKLETHIKKGQQIINMQINSEDELRKAESEEKKWRDYAITMLETMFDNPSYSDEFDENTHRFSFDRSPYYQEKIYFVQHIEACISELESISERLELIQLSPSATTPQPSALKDESTLAVKKIELIINRFDTFANQLKRRREGRTSLEIKDEYDLQYLFHAILRLFFTDIRPEEVTPSYAGSSSRIDFLLKAEQILIELKMTREGLKKKEIGDQISIDIQRYQSHQDCKMLVVFIYDPDNLVDNPKGVEYDLSKKVNDLVVKAYIRP